MRIYLLPALMLLFVACNSDAPKTESANTTQVSDGDRGKILFQQNCATCHSLLKDASGPALNGVVGRWNNNTVRLKAFIRNPSKLIFTDKDPLAVQSFEKYKPTVMTPFAGLTDKELDELIIYINSTY